MATSGIFRQHWIFVYFSIFCLLLKNVVRSSQDLNLECKDLLMGQYYCDRPDIDSKTQSAVGCASDGTVLVNCYPAPNVTCDQHTYNGSQVGFEKEVPCRYTNGVHYEVSVLLSVFLGMFGIDRFYLGYPAIGLLKLSTLGFFFLGQLIDIILIASQVVGPADGSEYIIDFFGARLVHITEDNETYYKLPDYW
ncbi:TM2 domain-containing protein biscotti-like [Ptychodera flava]|uniref:TM2 domain-containing protein biscotti-like n=1 Tax=Ptychodera flava TaxID=63121 RepID=UPI00396A25F9